MAKGPLLLICPLTWDKNRNGKPWLPAATSWRNPDSSWGRSVSPISSAPPSHALRSPVVWPLGSEVSSVPRTTRPSPSASSSCSWPAARPHMDTWDCKPRPGRDGGKDMPPRRAGRGLPPTGMTPPSRVSPSRLRRFGFKHHGQWPAGSATCCLGPPRCVDDLALDPLDAHRCDQSRAGHPADEHRPT